MLPGVRPTISRASAPITNGRLVRLSIATQDGSFKTMPLPRTLTNVLAVPRSMPKSRENRPKSALRGLNAIRFHSLFIQAPIIPYRSNLPKTRFLQSMRIDLFDMEKPGCYGNNGERPAHATHGTRA